jgi:hypothetical protein
MGHRCGALPRLRGCAVERLRCGGADASSLSGWPSGPNRPSELPARPMNVDGAGEGAARDVLPSRSWQGRKTPMGGAGARTGIFYPFPP